MAVPAILPWNQFFDNSGNPLNGGKLYSYIAGTSTPQALYTDDALSIPYSNPLILDSAGRPAGPVFMGNSNSYKFILHDMNDVAVGPTYDNVAPYATIF